MNLTSQLSFIESTISRIGCESISPLESTQRYLITLHKRIRDAVGDEYSPAPGTIYPLELAETVFLYVHVLCDYYRNLKHIRALSEEEKKIGQQLKELLGQTMGDLIREEKMYR